MIWCHTLLAREWGDKRFISVNVCLKSRLYALLKTRFKACHDRIDILRCNHLIVSCRLSSSECHIDGKDIQATTGSIDITCLDVSRWSTDNSMSGNGCLSQCWVYNSRYSRV